MSDAEESGARAADPFVRSLQQSEAVRLLADAYPSFLSYVDSSYRYLFCNQAYVDFFGVTKEQVVGKTVVELWGEDAFAIQKPRLERALAGELVTWETGRIGGTYRVASYVPHFGSDGVVRGVLVFTQDTTELNNARAGLIHAERMASLGRIVAGLMHELNTPLAAVRANAQTVGRSADRANQWIARGDDEALAKAGRALTGIAQAGETMDAAIGRLDELLASLRRFAAVDEAEVKVCAIPEILDDTLRLLAHRVDAGVRIERRYQDVPELACRAAGLNQIFMTLLTNALDAIGGSGTVEITCRARDVGVEVTIGDDGPGIAEDRLAGLFEPSFGATQDRTRAGFGLFVARNIARAHGGDIQVQSELGSGSRFAVLLSSAPLTD